MPGRQVVVRYGVLGRLVGWVFNPYRVVVGLFLLRLALEKGW